MRDTPPDAPGSSSRDRLMAAAACVFARHGAAGATTRRIAEAAGVNEVTLFRIFGSKDALLDAAVHARAAREGPAALPPGPLDPERDLAAWCAGELARLGGSADLLRRCFAEAGERGGRVQDAGTVVASLMEVLHEYVDRLARHAPLVDRGERGAVVTMLASAIVADALGSDASPHRVAGPTNGPPQYARTFLRALGWAPAAALGATPGGVRWAWGAPEGGRDG